MTKSQIVIAAHKTFSVCDLDYLTVLLQCQTLNSCTVFSPQLTVTLRHLARLRPAVRASLHWEACHSAFAIQTCSFCAERGKRAFGASRCPTEMHAPIAVHVWQDLGKWQPFTPYRIQPSQVSPYIHCFWYELALVASLVSPIREQAK